MAKDLVICRCEEVSMKDIVNQLKTYRCSAREIKLRTRAGMGYCGGRTCRALVDKVISEVTHEEIANDIPLKYRSPVRPIAFGELGESHRDA